MHVSLLGLIWDLTIGQLTNEERIMEILWCIQPFRYMMQPVILESHICCYLNPDHLVFTLYLAFTCCWQLSYHHMLVPSWWIWGASKLTCNVMKSTLTPSNASIVKWNLHSSNYHFVCIIASKMYDKCLTNQDFTSSLVTRRSSYDFDHP